MGAEHDHLFRTFRRLPPADEGEARWFARAGGRSWRGPFEAVEVAYLVASGRLAARDRVLRSETLEVFVVDEERFLDRWRRPSPARWRSLARALRRGIERRRAAAEARMADDERRAGALLGLCRPASVEEVRRRQRSLARRHHPDRGGDPEMMRAINRAAALLSARDPAVGGQQESEGIQ